MPRGHPLTDEQIRAIHDNCDNPQPLAPKTLAKQIAVSVASVNNYAAAYRASQANARKQEAQSISEMRMEQLRRYHAIALAKADELSAPQAAAAFARLDANANRDGKDGNALADQMAAFIKSRSWIDEQAQETAEATDNPNPSD